MRDDVDGRGEISFVSAIGDEIIMRPLLHLTHRGGGADFRVGSGSSIGAGRLGGARADQNDLVDRSGLHIGCEHVGGHHFATGTLHEARGFHHAFLAFGFHLFGALRQVGGFLTHHVEGDGVIGGFQISARAFDGDDCRFGDFRGQGRGNRIRRFKRDVARFKHRLHIREILAEHDAGLAVDLDGDIAGIGVGALKAAARGSTGDFLRVSIGRRIRGNSGLMMLCRVIIARYDTSAREDAH